MMFRRKPINKVQAVKIRFTDGEETITTDSSLVVHAVALQRAKGEVNSSYSTAIASQIRTAYGTDFQWWDLIEVSEDA